MYSIYYNIKKHYTYKVIITAKNNSTTEKPIGLQVRMDDTESSTDCKNSNPYQLVEGQEFSSNSFQNIGSTTFQDYTFTSNQIISNKYKLDIGTFSKNAYTNPVKQNIYIKKIKIIEIPPPPTFNFNTTKQISCGTTTAQAFTVTNVYSTPNVTYEWNAPGWYLNGSLVTAPFMGGAIVNLVPSNNPGNVSVTPIINGTERHTTKTCTVSLVLFTNSGIYMSGKESICFSSGATQIYTLTGLPVNASVVWESLNPSVATIVSQSTTQATITINSLGSFKLKTTITNACGQIVYKSSDNFILVTNVKPIAKIVGSEPDPNKIYNKYDDLIIYFQDQNNSVQFDASNFEFLLDNSSDFSLMGVYGNVAVLNVKYSSPFLSLGFQTRAKNDCGWSNWEYKSFLLQGYDPNYPYYGYRVTSFANTASSELEITIDEDTLSEDKNITISKSDEAIESYSIEIASLYGKSVYKKDKLKSKKIKIKTTGWLPGVYYMKISNSKGLVQQKAIIIQ